MGRIAGLLAVAAVIGASGGLAVACGDFGTTRAPAPKPDAAVDSGAVEEPPEERVLSFPCGETKCFAGEQACCQVGPAFSCFGIDAGGCPFTAGDGGGAADAGAPGPAMLCTSYRNCSLDEDCCYRRDQASSSCESHCPQGAENLCTLGVDGCGTNAACQSLQNPPQPGVGACKDTGGNKYPGGGSSGHF